MEEFWHPEGSWSRAIPLFLEKKEQHEVIRTSGSDASCAPPFGAFLGSIKGEEIPRHTQNPLEKFCIFFYVQEVVLHRKDLKEQGV